MRCKIKKFILNIPISQALHCSHRYVVMHTQCFVMKLYRISLDNLDSMIGFAKEFSKKTGAVIAITGAIDLVADSDKCYIIRNGSPIMSRITGTGCMLSALAAAYAVANPDNLTEAVAASVCLMGLAGEMGVSNMKEKEGNSSLRNHIIDSIYNMDAEKLIKGAKYEVR